MLKKFLEFIRINCLFQHSDHILLAVSGGGDSVVMGELFYRAGFDFGVAHCNFQLRGLDSDRDESFVKNRSEQWHKPFFVSRFDTKTIAKEKDISIQMAARELRYQWFEEIRKKENFSCIATAHHQTDSIETALLNYIRGTGISGLHGILPENNKIIRPMLFTSKKDIMEFADREKIQFREDPSNREDKYARNLMRNKIFPLLKKINPGLESTLLQNNRNFHAAEKILAPCIASAWRNVCIKAKEKQLISIKKLKELDPLDGYLFEFLKPVGFNVEVVRAICRSLGGQPGKQFYSLTHRLTFDRSNLILEEINRHPSDAVIKVNASDRFAGFGSYRFLFRKIKPVSGEAHAAACKNFKRHPFLAHLDFDLLEFPLLIRNWKPGDRFIPFGMTGSKKLSDFFIDKKIPRADKEKIPVLQSGKDIVWVVGYRVDERYKITKQTGRVFVCKVIGTK